MYRMSITNTKQVSVLSYIPAYYFDEVSKFTFCGTEKMRFLTVFLTVERRCKVTNFSWYDEKKFAEVYRAPRQIHCRHYVSVISIELKLSLQPQRDTDYFLLFLCGIETGNRYFTLVTLCFWEVFTTQTYNKCSLLLYCFDNKATTLAILQNGSGIEST